MVNNLPAYLALEPVAADAPQRLMALLIGVNGGPLVTPWASLATLLWRAAVPRAAWRRRRPLAAQGASVRRLVAVAALTWLALARRPRLRTHADAAGRRTVDLGEAPGQPRARWRSSIRSRGSSSPTEIRTHRRR